jgi:L-seryl-tRNA(Ser) seleniumtransferase
VGGGAFPGTVLRTTLVALDAPGIGANGLALRLRLGAPPVIARVERDRMLLDPRTLSDDDVPIVVAALLGIAGELEQEA